jgi:hypothetical protein
MKNKRFFYTGLVMAVVMGICFPSAAFTDDLFSIAPAAMFSWYLHTDITEESTKTEIDTDNYGMSFIMGLKLFNKVGAQLNLTVDDPTFQKLIDFMGYFDVYNVIPKFDYHSFGGNVTWQSDTPDPIPNNKYNFRNNWNNVSLLYNWGNMIPSDVAVGYMVSVGVGYFNFTMPVEYKIKNKEKLTYPGFGMIDGKIFGLSIFIDTLAAGMNLTKDVREGKNSTGMTILRGTNLDLWIYTDFFLSLFGGTLELEKNAINNMSAKNNSSIDSDIKPDSDTFFRASAIIGLQKVWDISEKFRIGLAIGVDLLTESIKVSNDDIEIDYSLFSVGPAIRLSMKF